MSLQKTFLRVLQEHSFRPLGSKKEQKSNFRLIAATNRNLNEMVEAGKFRDDLLYRLRTIVIESPALRHRPEDIKDLAMYHLGRFCEKSRIMMKGFSPDFFEVLRSYPWPGNVRELVHTLEGVVVSAQNEPILYPYHLPTHIRTEAARASLGSRGNPPAGEGSLAEKDFLSAEPLLTFKDYRVKLLEKGEKRYFNRLVSYAGGNVQEACRLSGLSRSRLYYFLQRHTISLSGSIPPESNKS